MITTQLARELHWWRVAHLGTSRLVRPIDRVESALQTGLVVASVTIVPLVIVAAQSIYTDYDRPHDHGEAVVATVFAVIAMTGVVAAVYGFLADTVGAVADNVRNRAWDKDWTRMNSVTTE
ncbi:hypothetical protein [Tsukamurella soli]|uniref:Uncharacterized protein n=1 Tax=Tsukamurella soli TaxID=644556 RepID=A0ABP8JNK6_9ACTN